MKKKISYLKLLIAIIFFISVRTGLAQCNASFIYGTGANGTISFTSTSAGTFTNTNFFWQFGNGATYTSVGFSGTITSQTYTSNGVYTVTLTLSAATTPTCSSVFIQTVSVTNACALVSNFITANGSNGSLNFTNTSTGAISTTTYSIAWGDGNFNGTIPHQYAANGTYTVTLSASNGATCTSNVNHTITITNACNLSAGFNIATGTFGTVNFTNTSTGTTPATIYGINWGDGVTTSLASSHQYAANGTYTISLFASNSPTSSVCSSTISNTVTISNACVLAASFTVVQGANGNVTVVNTSTGTTSTTSYTIAWGDGTFYGPNPHQYTTNGVYTITLSAQDFGFCYSNATYNFTVTTVCPPITPNFSYSLGVNGHVTFSNTSIGTGTANTYGWLYYSSTSSTPVSMGNNANASNTFSANGNYTVSFSMSATPSCTYSVTHTLTVTNVVGPCSASFTYTQGTGYSIHFNSTSTNTTSGSTYNWHFGDSSATSTGTGSGTSPIHTYTNSGSYLVSVLVHDTINNVFCTAQQTITVIGTPSCNLVIHAGLSHTVGAGGLVNYESTSTGTTTASHYYWNFGDGYFNTGNPVNHLYVTGGAYVVKLIVTNTICSDTLVQSVNVTGLSCNANANFTLTPSGIPQVWNAIPAYPWNVTSAVWSWGDGSTSNSLYTSHTYSVAGNYSICLTVILSCGDTATYCAPYYVNRSNDANSSIILVNVLPPPSILTTISAQHAEALDYNLYPNPNDGSFSLELSSIVGKVNVSVYNLIGSLVYEQESESLGNSLSREVKLDTPSGIYFIKVSSGSKTYTKKFIINK